MNIKLGKFTLPDYAAEKPVMIRSDGQLIYASELLKKTKAPAFGIALASPENKAKLAIARLKCEPDFVFGVIGKNGSGGNGMYTKAEVLQNIKERTSLGLQFTDIEVNYAVYFANQLLGHTPRISPKLKISNIRAVMPSIPKDWKWVPKSYWRFFKNIALFCENTTDAVTTPAANYRIANVHPVFAAKGFDVVNLQGVNDVRASFTPIAKSYRTVYISGIGHGSYTTYTGHLFDPILQVGGYDGTEVVGTVIHFLSCETGRTLGPDTVSHGAKAYVGYDENFVFDWTNANLYWQCDSQFDISMANGKTVEQAIADTTAKYDVAIASVPGTSTAATLLNDRNLLRSPVSGPAWGSKTKRIYPYMFYQVSFSVFASQYVLSR
jgi:hypothetical protein